MCTHRVVLATLTAVALSLPSFETAFGQDAAAPQAASAPTIIKPVLDVGSRSIRLDPLAMRVPIPDGIAVRSFDARDNYMSLATHVGGSMLMDFEVNFRWANVSPDAPAVNCEVWDKARTTWTTHKRKVAKKGAAFYDSRWHPAYYDRKGWVQFCLDRPGGIVTIESTPLNQVPTEPMKQFTANLADAFLPHTVQAQAPAAAAPAPAPATSVKGVFPRDFLEGTYLCLAGDPRTRPEVFCRYFESFLKVKSLCEDGYALSCISIADGAAKNEDHKVAATYYQRACDLGNKGACRKAQSSKQKAGN